MLFTILRVSLIALPLLVTWCVFVLYAFLRYRFLRQEELAHVLAAAAESGAPLAPALWAYVRDRPRDEWRTFWVIVVLFFALPGYYFYWRRHGFERKVARAAGLLETGYTLHQALKAARGAASREVVLAAAVGESTGQLATSLRLAPRWRLGPVWLEAAPRLIYPLFLVGGSYLVTAFLVTFILPKYQKIFADFKVELPPVTQALVASGDRLIEAFGTVLLGAFALAFLGFALLVSPSLRWYCPGLGRLHRMQTQGRLLRMLGLLLGAGRPLPQALGLLTDSGYFRGPARRRLARACRRLEEGEPLADTLRRAGLLPRSMVGLVQAAERAHNLPWALGELGELRARRAVRISERVSLAVFPITVLAVGVLVGFVAFGMFLPLLELLAEVGR